MRPTSNAQHDQRYKSDADEQRYERDGVVFEPMPITGKHWTDHPLNVLPQPPVASLLQHNSVKMFFGQTDVECELEQIPVEFTYNLRA